MNTELEVLVQDIEAADREDGSAYAQARLFLIDYKDYVNGVWCTSPDRAYEVLGEHAFIVLSRLREKGFEQLANRWIDILTPIMHEFD